MCLACCPLQSKDWTKRSQTSVTPNLTQRDQTKTHGVKLPQSIAVPGDSAPPLVTPKNITSTVTQVVVAVVCQPEAAVVTGSQRPSPAQHAPAGARDPPNLHKQPSRKITTPSPFQATPIPAEPTLSSWVTAGTHEHTPYISAGAFLPSCPPKQPHALNPTWVLNTTTTPWHTPCSHSLGHTQCMPQKAKGSHACLLHAQVAFQLCRKAVTACARLGIDHKAVTALGPMIPTNKHP